MSTHYYYLLPLLSILVALILGRYLRETVDTRCKTDPEDENNY